MSIQYAQQVGKALKDTGQTLAVAESCTGGLIGHLLTEVPGSSDYFLGGIIAYSNQAKQEHLGVSEETLKNHGAVSQQTAAQMAAGARDALGANLAISVTGVAGPTGGSPEKPVGLTWIGLASSEGTRAEKFRFDGDRTQNKLLAATAALKLLLNHLGGADG